MIQASGDSGIGSASSSTAASTTAATVVDRDDKCWRIMPTTTTPDDDLSRRLDDEMIWQDRIAWDGSAVARYKILYDSFRDCDDVYLKPLIDEALDGLLDTIRLYQTDSILCSFNGGKDATVILHLFCAALAAHAVLGADAATTSTTTTTGADAVAPPPATRPRGVYFDSPDEFAELRRFTQDSVQRVDMDLLAFAQGVSFVDGLTRLQVAHHPRPLAFVLGTRQGDPNAHGQGMFAPSSSWMPPFMRINPIINWNYGHVWHFLRHYDLPYCTLYDAGYTSLGSVHDTLPCPALRRTIAAPSTTTITDTSNDGDDDNSCDQKYLPAYMLRDWDQERSGRISNSSPSKKKKQQPSSTAAMRDDSVQSVSRTAPETELAEDDNGPGSEPILEDDDHEDTDSTKMDNQMPTTVAILIVGDEILKGFTADTNTLVAARALKKHNVVLKQVVVVSDTLHEIAQELRRLRCIVDVVITSGGVGPTNDDVTISGVAAALDMTISHHEEMAALIRQKMNVSEAQWTESLNKMAQLPQQAKLRYLSGPDAWPVLQCQNVFVLPGIPEFFGPKVESVAEFLSYHARGLSYKVVLKVDETSIVDILNHVVNSHPSVAIGSYPFVSQPEFKTVVTVEGQPDDDVAVQRALTDLVDRVPAGSVLRVDTNMTLFGG
jgi:FAD synthetase